MNYKEIEQKFESEEGMESILSRYQEVFDKVHYYEDLFRNGIIDTPNETDIAMKELTGLYMSLLIVSSIAETQKDNREIKYFNQQKIEKEKYVGKIVIGILEKESSEHVALYRRIRNIFIAYRDSCEKAISVCQSSLKSLEREKTVKHD